MVKLYFVLLVPVSPVDQTFAFIGEIHRSLHLAFISFQGLRQGGEGSRLPVIADVPVVDDFRFNGWIINKLYFATEGISTSLKRKGPRRASSRISSAIISSMASWPSGFIRRRRLLVPLILAMLSSRL